MPKTILVVDDEPMIHTMLRRILTGEGYETTHASGGEEAMALAAERPYDLILLDVLMPDTDGLEICQQLRRTTNVPILFVTSKSTLFDKAACFGAGGDDFIEKPFQPEEILMRVGAHIRRYKSLTGGYEPPDRKTVLSYPPLTIDMDYRRVTIHNRLAPLTATEFKILGVLARNPNRYFSADQLISSIWNKEESIDDHSLVSHISKLRKKLGETACCIVTIRNMGYKFVPQNSAGEEKGEPR